MASCLGVLWALAAPLPKRLEAFVVALSGGALLIAAVLELIQPVLAQHSSPIGAFLALGAGGVLYSVVLVALERCRWTDQAGTIGTTTLLNGIPENLAVGITLIGHSSLHITGLIGSILLANIPEAAGASKELRERGYCRGQIIRIWGMILTALAAATVVGHYGFSSANPQVLGYLRCFAAGAIISSLAVDVFPKAFNADHRLTGIATVLGVVLALALNRAG